MTDEINLSKILTPDLSDEEIGREVSEYCRINLSNLEESLSRQSSLYSYTVAAYELAKVAEARAKWECEETKAEAFKLLSSQDPKLTISALDRMVLLTNTVKRAMGELFKAQGNVARLKALVAGLEHRRDMLVQISARQRQEMGMG